MAFAVVFWQAGISKAEPMGTAWTYQGRLMDTNDPADGIYDFEFELYDAPNGGVQEGNTIDVNDLDVINGYFTVELDFGSGVFDGDARWLAIGVRPGDSNNLDPFVTLSPRQEVTPTPYALYAASGPGVPVPLDLSGSVAYPGTVIKGTNTGTGYGVYGKHDSSGNYGYLGYSNFGVYGYSYSDYGVRGYGGSYGVYGLSSDGYGVCGESTNSYGVYGKNHSSGNYGYLGYYYLGVCGRGDSFGVYGSSSDGYGVYGQNNSSGNYGYLGGSDSGVYGYSESSSDYGVRGHHAGSGTGVYGRCDNGFGGYFIGAKNYFVGNVGIGTTSPGAGLHLKGAGYPSSFMYLQSDANEDAGIRLYEGDTEKWHIFNSSSDGGLMICNNAYQPVLFADQSTGNVGIGTNSPTKKLTVRGNILVQSESTGASVAEIGEGLDYAEGFDVTEDADIEAGMVLVIDSENPGKLALSRSAYDSKVAGIVAGANGIGSGVRLGIGQFDYDVALAGRVYCNVDATVQAVQAGDLLTTSPTPGYAMKATDYDRARGAILGKAMQKLQQGQKGQILVLVTLQ